MTPSWLLQKTTPLVTAGLLAVGGYYFIRGHNHPGGGFVGGLVLSAIVSSFSLGRGGRVRPTRPYLPYAAFGLFITISSGFIGTLLDIANPFLTSYWANMKIPLIGKIGTPLVFDLGIMLTVAGVVSHFVDSFAGSRSLPEASKGRGLVSHVQEGRSD